MNDYSKVWGGGYEIYTSRRTDASSENIILSLILEKFDIKSMVDFGCAVGTWCREGKNLGIAEVLGIDGEYVNQEALVIDQDEFIGTDLGDCIELPKRYDLAVSLEVAEHLPKDKSDIFIENLVRASDMILFSAAIPGQGGDFHVNEQFMSYWENKFKKFGYYLYDYLRPIIWNNENVSAVYRQNCVIFMKKLKDNSIVQDEHIVDIVHPKLFLGFSKKGIALFPFHKVVKDSKIVLYGAGVVGNMYYRQLQATDYCKEIIWIDRTRSQACVNNKAVDVYLPDLLKTIEADYYVVAVQDKNTAKEIIMTLNTEYKIDLNKIIYESIQITRS